MRLISSFAYILLFIFSITNVELTSSFKDQFRRFVTSVASTFHKNWRKDFHNKHPPIKNRFKLTKNGSRYNSSDFIYPMVLTVGSCLVHRNLKVARARYNSSLIYVDILNMDYDELPEDWAYENLATARIACKEVLQNVRHRRLFNRNLIETISEKIHNAWIKRNENRAKEELVVSYAHLPDIEKDKDRKAVLVACRLFNELRLYRIFQTTPIHLIESPTEE